MKTSIIRAAWLVSLALTTVAAPSAAQSHEAQVLLLDVQKLSQLKATLQDMKKGYEVLSEGYAAVRDIAQADFSLQKAFLDARWLASPEVRGYWKVAATVSLELAVVKDCHAGISRLKGSGAFREAELDYLQRVYQGVITGVLGHLDDLTNILTDGTFQMSDPERMEAIDRIYGMVKESQGFVAEFTGHALELAIARSREQTGARALEALYGL